MPNPVKKKAARVTPDELRKIADSYMADFTAEAKVRYDRAHKVYEKQDDDTPGCARPDDDAPVPDHAQADVGRRRQA
jgi:hypothetical protein